MTSWIFQGNPNKFQINKYLLSRKIILWDIRQECYVSKVLINDDVYIWRSDDRHFQGGIIAVGKIITLPGYFPDDSIRFWIVQQELLTKLKVKIRLSEVRLDEKHGMLTRSTLNQDPQLSTMKILSYFSQTNYLLNDKHAERIMEIWTNNIRN